ncbi:MAG: hypothetical protein K6F20_08400 [Bacteroidaceae bacterium]|nr:hypothetical protein [Bacteroidaceae bacterium]
MKKILLSAVTIVLACLGMRAQDAALDKLNIVNDVVQIATTEDLVNFAQAVNEGNKDLNAVLTADIANFEGPAISLEGEGNAYSGTFDGQYHAIDINLTTTGANYGLFRALKGTVKNLQVSGTFNAANNRVGVICGEIFGGTIESCWSSANIIATYVGDGAISGICGRASGTGSTIRNCIFSGNVESPDLVSYNCAGIVGWCPNPIDLVNCVVTGEFKTDQLQGNARPIARYDDANNTNAQCVNCFFVNINGDKENINTTKVTEEQMKSGEIAYLLNGDQSAYIWFQNIGEDAVPVPFPTHKTVYASGELRCDGAILEDNPLTFSNTEDYPTKPDHQFDEGGICIVCGQADPSKAELVDGYYLISSAEQLQWFSAKVNNGDLTANAKLTEDIDLGALPDAFKPIGNSSNRYAGIFDGQYHTITTNMVALEANYGLFRALSGTVKNLHVDGTFDAAYNRVGVLVGEMFGGLVENCWVSADIAATYSGDGAIAGICGRSSADGNVIRNCVFSGNVNGIAYNCAGIVGWCANLIAIQNCLVTGEFNTDQSQGNARPIARYDAASNTNADCLNCYYVNPNGTDTNINTTQVTMEQVRSGAVAEMLNAGSTEITWFQRLGEDEVPTTNPERGIIYHINNVYGNAYDSESFDAFKTAVIDAETEYAQNVVAQTILSEEYEAAITNALVGDNIDELLAAWAQIESLYQQVAESEKAYAAYSAKVNSTIEYLEANEALKNVKRDELEFYLKEFDEPGEKYGNGTATYILEERLLDTEEIKAETAKIDAMLNAALTYEPASGTDITKLLTNPDLEKGFNGWQGAVGDAYDETGHNSVHAGQRYNGTMDMYQTLTGLQNGIYEFQVNGAFRPYPGADDLFNTNYAGMLYANGNVNYFQALIEDMMPAEEAIDGYNCHTTGDVPDFEVKDIDENVIGYVVRGVVGSSIAFGAGRYFNTILCEVTDGTLTVGIKQPGTGQQPEWLGFGNIKLIYHGTIDEADDALSNVLASQAARAETLANVYEYSSDANYATYPNFSQELKDQLNAAIEAVNTTTGVQAKYALVQKFSDLFQQVYDCKKAYINLMDQSEKIVDMVDAFSSLLSEDETKQLYAMMDELIAKYETGSVSAEEARQDYLSQFAFMPQQVDGVYQIGTPMHFIMFRALVNGSTPNANAVLTADIDMGDNECFNIGNATQMYAGTFDGKYHTLTVNYVMPEANSGLFGGLSGTVKNLHLAGKVEAKMNRSGTIVGELFKGHVENCWSSVELLATYGGDTSVGGIAGRGSEDGSFITNCLFSGVIDAAGTGTYNCAGILGWAGAGKTYIDNCLTIADINVDKTQGNPRPIGRYDSSQTTNEAICTNCYFIDPNSNSLTNEGAYQVTMEQVQSGEVCFRLNGKQENIQWTQTLGEDAVPVPYPTKSIVYIQGKLNCDGISVLEGEAKYGNEKDPNTTIAPHQFVDGVCIVCGAADTSMAELKDGYYQLGTIEQLIWFASLINSGEKESNAQLTADIDLRGYEDQFTPIGTSANHFAGTFDGQYHTINVNLVATESSYGFFRYLDGTVKNLHIGGSFEAKFNKTGVICGEIFGGVIENCWVSSEIAAVFGGDAATAGIVGRGSKDGSIIRNCLVTSNIDQGETTTWNCAGIMGWSGNKSTIENCLFTGKITVDESQGNGNVIARNPGNITYVNDYYVNAYGEASEGCTQVTEDQLASGEACYLLNGDQANNQWFQTIGEQTFPLPFPGTTVAKNDDGSYYNAIQNIAEDKAQETGIYNLMGQKVEKAGKGIFIVNGKKVLFK